MIKIRLSGTKEELIAIAYRLRKTVATSEQVKSMSISPLYANRNSVNIYRLYVDVELNAATLEQLNDGQ